MIYSTNGLEKTINLDYLLELSKGNKPFVKEMIETFLEENPKEIASLEKAIRAQNFESIKQIAHLLLSSMPFVGLDKLIESELYEIEKIAGDRAVREKTAVHSEDTVLIQKIEPLFARVKKVSEKACL